MRMLILILTSAFLFSGCAKIKSWLPSRPKKDSVSSSASPLDSVGLASGVVARVNLNARYVVATFPLGEVPQIERRLNVYRGGLKVAEIKVTGPQRDNSTVADILAGEVQVNDEVRAD